MKRSFPAAKIVFGLASLAIAIGISSLAQKQNGERYSFRKENFSKYDTSSRKRNSDSVNWSLGQLDEQMKQLSEQMQHLDAEFETKKYENEKNPALQQLDFDKVQKELNEAFYKTDWEEINGVLENRLQNINKKDINNARKEMEKMKMQLQQQQLAMKLSKIDGAKINGEIRKALSNAKKSMAAAKEEIELIRQFTCALEKDGLINKDKGYKLEVKDGNLYIDGKQQLKETSDKYRKYYRKNNFSIDMAPGDEFKV